MDRTPLPVPEGYKDIQGRPWVEFKNRVRAHLVVPVNLDTTRCIACTHAVTESEGGRKEHLRSGLCEQCWDILVHGPSLERDALAAERCDRLREDPLAHEFVSQWVGLAKIKDEGRCISSENHVKYMIRVVLGQETLPDLWRPGMRPQP